MAENVTTVPFKPEVTLEQLKTDAVNNLLYLIHGLGRDRDKTLDIDVLKQYIADTLMSLKVNNVSSNGNKITIESGNQGYPRYSITISSNKIEFKKQASPYSIFSTLIIDADVGIYSKVSGPEQSPVYILELLNIVSIAKSLYVAGTVTVGSTDSQAPLVVHGDAEFGDSDEENSVNIHGSVNIDKGIAAQGDISTVGTITGGIVGANMYRISNIVSKSSAYSLAQEQGVTNPGVSDTVFIRNTSDNSIKITIENTVTHGTGTIKSVQLSSGCCVGFICVYAAAASSKSKWAPMSSMTVTTENVSQ